ncbi:D-lyxose/D-mannose family sugar isomerase [Phaeobacter sp. C3_T13_0]|uniref:D-lyxose/D-mannose family sugar isomerase n=1 Tax=Phaeobacter cretensis TaxID=3342641 RepID=UPI0039BCECF6
MKRSEINDTIKRAKLLLEAHRWSLPDWAHWSAADYEANKDLAVWLNRHQMGWDVTDFGSGDFTRRGLGLFCLRNGVQSSHDSLPYAEKLLFVGENQETPFHTHKVKLEDIINRGGGDLVLEFRQPEGVTEPIELRCDGVMVYRQPDEPLVLTPGQSVTIPRGLFHRFYAKPGTGMVLGGEVSQVNDDGADNYFLEPLGRFSAIEEDEASLHPLWNEIGTAS